jgi:uncharacterized protein (DUF3084 family)
MLTPFVLFFGLTVATAIIAYWSDNLGKKLGKKRISLLGMRPRTTATVLTIASSWGIMLFTLLAMLIVAEPLRDALFRFDRERAENRELRLLRDELVSQKNEIEAQLSNREERLITVEKRAEQAGKNALVQTQNARKAQDAAKSALEQQRLASNREASARKSETIAKRGAVDAAKRADAARKGQVSAENQARTAFLNLGKVQAQLQQNNNRLTQARLNLANTESNLSKANTRLALAQKKLDEAAEKLEVTNTHLQDTRDKLTGSYKNLAEAYRINAEAYRESQEAQRERDFAQQQVNDLKKQQSDLEERIAALRETANAISADLNTLSTRPVLVAVNQTLVARTLPPGLTEGRIESHLRSLLTLANKEVGPSLLPNSKVELSQYIQTPDGRLLPVPEEEVFAAAAAFIAASGRSVSVRLVSHSNFAEGEPVIRVRLEVVEVKKALSAGEVLAQRTIDGKIGDAAIFNALLALVEAGRREATRKGVNPSQTPDEPNFYENGTNEQIFVALRQIESSGKPVTVKIVAAEDLSTVEPVRVRFEVK